MLKISNLLVMVCFGLFLVSCASKQDGIKSKQAVLYFGAGTQSLMSQDYTEALTALVKANQLEPGNSDILNNLGMAYYFKGDAALGVKHLKESLRINPENSDTKTNLASIYYKNGDVDQAEKIYKNVMKDLTYDKQARTFYNLGILEKEKRKNLPAAENYFLSSIKEDSNYCPAYYELGMIEFETRQFKAALKNFKEASSGVCYESPAAHYQVALTHIAMRAFDDARIKLEEVDSRFHKTVYAVKARSKLIEVNTLENNYRTIEAQAPRKVLESPAF